MSNPQETNEERQQRLYEERLRERGQELVPRHQPAPVEFPVASSESASVEEQPQPQSESSNAATVNPHPVRAFQARREREERCNHTRRRAQWLFTQAAQTAREEALEARRLQQVARAPRRLRRLVSQSTFRVRAMQMRHGLVAVPSHSSVSPPSSSTTTSEDTEWSQDMEVDESDHGDDGDDGAGGAGAVCSSKYGPKMTPRLARYGPR